MLYLVRHCATAGREPDAPLTPEGERQAELLAVRLADELSPAGSARLVSSPYRRAVDSVQPLAERLGVGVRTDERLRERVLCGAPRPDWRERLRASFGDADLCLEGGESSREATARGLAALAGARLDGAPTVVVTHGNLLALLLRELDGRDGFGAWAAMTNPAVYRVRDGAVQRLG